MEFAELKGKTLKDVSVNGDISEVHFVLENGERYRLYHSQDCCESVDVEDVVGDLSDLIGSPLLQAQEATSEERPANVPDPGYTPESETWTFYNLATIKGSVTIRWHGTSNGYYSESVSFGAAD